MVSLPRNAIWDYVCSFVNVLYPTFFQISLLYNTCICFDRIRVTIPRVTAKMSNHIVVVVWGVSLIVLQHAWESCRIHTSPLLCFHSKNLHLRRTVESNASYSQHEFKFERQGGSQLVRYLVLSSVSVRFPRSQWHTAFMTQASATLRSAQLWTFVSNNIFTARLPRFALSHSAPSSRQRGCVLPASESVQVFFLPQPPSNMPPRFPWLAACVLLTTCLVLVRSASLGKNLPEQINRASSVETSSEQDVHADSTVPSKGSTTLQPECPGCAEKTSDPAELNLLRIELIKQQILQKLRLPAEPNITQPVPRQVLLRALGKIDPTMAEEPANSVEKTQAVEYYAQTKEIISFSEPGK